MSKWSDVSLWASEELENSMVTYRHFMGMFLHFKGSYNWHKYGDCINVPTETFLARKDRMQFVKLDRQFRRKDDSELIAHLAANFIANPKCWIHFLVSEKAHQIRRDFIAEQEGFHYSFRTFISDNIQSICNKQGCTFMQLFKPVDAETYPWFLRGLMADKFPMSHVVAFNRIFGFVDMYDKMYVGDANWETISDYIKKIQGFYVFDVETTRKWLIEYIIENKLN